MLGLDPHFDHFLELVGVQQDFRGFSRRGDADAGIVDDVALPSASLKIIQQRFCLVPQRKSGSFKCERVMARHRADAVACASDRHLRGLKSGIIAGGESSVLGKGGDCSVLEIALHNGTKLVQLLLASLVLMHFARREQLRPAHPQIPSA